MLKSSLEKRYKLYTFSCKYIQDVEKFKKLVIKLGGHYTGDLVIDFLNCNNNPVGFCYVCLYYYNKEIDMEILC